MKLQNNVQLNKIEFAKQQKTPIQQQNSNVVNYSNAELKSYPASYYLNFGTRTIKEVYDDCAETQMPITVKNFIDDLELSSSREKFEKLINQPQLYQIHREAFRELGECTTVEDVKNAFPNEKCLNTILSIDEVPTLGGGIFNLVSAKQKQGVKVFDIEEDLSVYIAKELFYECTSMTDIQKKLASLALDKDIKEKIEKSSTWSARTFSPLGISIPDGKKYGKAVLYSTDRKYVDELSEAIRDSWKTLSSEEATVRIDKLLQGSKKERITMIDAWNKCIALRNELSDFLYANFNNSEYKADRDKFAVGFYEGGFSAKMRKLMTDFWEANPAGKEELSLEIRKSRKLYEQKASEGPEALEAYEREILTKRNVIKQKLLEERRLERSYDKTKEAFRRIAQNSKQMYFKTPEVVDDLCDVLLKHIPNNKLKLCELYFVHGKNQEEFNAYFPPVSDIAKAKNSMQYYNIQNAQIATILTPGLKRGRIKEEDVIRVLLDKNEFDNFINTTKENRTSLELAEYSRMKKLLTQSEKESVKKALVAHLDKNEQALALLDGLLDTQGKYLLNVTSENKSVRNVATILILDKLDKMCDSNYVGTFVEKIEEEKRQQSKLDAIYTIDWSAFKTSAWDV